MSDFLPSEVDVSPRYKTQGASSLRGYQGRDKTLPLTWTVMGVAPATISPSGAALGVKRVADIVISMIALLLLCPLLALVALMVKIDSPGPVFFRQAREGRDGKLFSIFKFRSMSIDLGDPTGVAQTKDGDVRVTRLGRFLRKTSIDELPQLFNVLLGDMSIIGPRPHVPGMLAAGKPYRELVPYYDARLAVRPGLSGWAQANGLRGSTDSAAAARARVDYDIAYIQNYSLMLDLKIIWMTLRHEFFGGSGN